MANVIPKLLEIIQENGGNKRAIVRKITNDSKFESRAYKWLDGIGEPKTKDTQIIEDFIREYYKNKNKPRVFRQEPDPDMTYTPHTTSERVQITAPTDKDQRIKELEERLEKAEKNNERLLDLLTKAMQKG